MASNGDDNDQLLKDVAKNFTSLLDVKEIKEKERFIESLDQVLVKLEKTVDDVDLMRIDSRMTLDTTMREIKQRTEDLEGYFDKIDKLEAFINMVKGQVNELEKAVDKAESTMTASPIKRVLSAIPFLKKIKPDTVTEQQGLKYEPTPIFDSNLFFKTSNETGKASSSTTATATTSTVTEVTTATITSTISPTADISSASSSSLSSLSSSVASTEPLALPSTTPTTLTTASNT